MLFVRNTRYNISIIRKVNLNLMYGNVLSYKFKYKNILIPAEIDEATGDYTLILLNYSRLCYIIENPKV
jgi:hypothetical protein